MDLCWAALADLCWAEPAGLNRLRLTVELGARTLVGTQVVMPAEKAELKLVVKQRTKMIQVRNRTSAEPHGILLGQV